MLMACLGRMLDMSRRMMTDTNAGQASVRSMALPVSVGSKMGAYCTEICDGSPVWRRLMPLK
jgi:hypothetical protein